LAPKPETTVPFDPPGALLDRLVGRPPRAIALAGGALPGGALLDRLVGRPPRHRSPKED
jgi:hypothetical protein